MNWSWRGEQWALYIKVRTDQLDQLIPKENSTTNQNCPAQVSRFLKSMQGGDRY